MIKYLLCFILFSVGLFCVLNKRNLIRIIIGLVIMEYAVSLFLVLAGAREIVFSVIIASLVLVFVLTAIALKVHEKYKTFDITQIRRLKG